MGAQTRMRPTAIQSLSTTSSEIRALRERPPNAFERFAEASARFVSKGTFFTVSVLVVAIWIPTIALFDDADTWQLVMNTVVSVLAFLLIALLQNSERRYGEALHRKIDAVATGLADLMEHLEEEDPERLRRHVDGLRDSIQLERRR